MEAPALTAVSVHIHGSAFSAISVAALMPFSSPVKFAAAVLPYFDTAEVVVATAEVYPDKPLY